MLNPTPNEGCLFCSVIAAPEERDRENLVLVRRDLAFAMLNRFPYTAGHVMVVPVAHVESPEALGAADRTALAEMLTDSLAALRRAVGPDGMNVGMNVGKAAGAGIAEHCHWHLVPRFEGDVNFASVVGGVRVVPEDLDTTWGRLAPFFR